MRTTIKTIAFLLLGACGSGGEKLSSGDEYALKSASSDLAAVKTALAAGEDPGYKCASVKAAVERLSARRAAAGVAALLDEGARVCGHDVPLATLERETKKAEEARLKQPEGTLSECYSGPQRQATEALEKEQAGDGRFQELRKRWNAVCPPKKS